MHYTIQRVLKAFVVWRDRSMVPFGGWQQGSMVSMLMGTLLMGGVGLYGFRTVKDANNLTEAVKNVEVGRVIFAKAIQAVQSEESLKYTALAPGNSSFESCISVDGVDCPVQPGQPLNLYRKTYAMTEAELLTGNYDRYGDRCTGSNCTYRLYTYFRGRCAFTSPCDYVQSINVGLTLKVYDKGNDIYRTFQETRVNTELYIADASDDTTVCEGEDLFVNSLDVREDPSLWTCITASPPSVKPTNVVVDKCLPGEYLQKINADGSFNCKKFGG